MTGYSYSYLRPRRTQGFTLIEVLLALAVIGILAAIVIPRITRAGLYNRYLVYTTAHKITADMRLARRLAVTTRDNHQVKFYKDDSSDYNQYEIQQRVGKNWVLVGVIKDIPDEIIVSGDRDIRFKPDGSANRNRTFNYELGNYRYRITIRRTTSHVKLEVY